MTDREYVESTVAYLAEHVPWMWHELLDEYGVGLWERDSRIPPSEIIKTKILDTPTFYDMNDGYDHIAKWLDRQLVTQGRPDHPSPLVSADWWEERGESRLAELLRRQEVARCKLTAEEVKAIRDEVAKDLEGYPDD